MAAETSPWIKLFEKAGLPPKIALKYSMLFLEHRIQRNMLGDLTKSILNEVGITAVGDVLAILKQAKAEANTDEVEMKEVPQKVAVIAPSERSPTKVNASPVAVRLAASPKATATATMTTVSSPKRVRRESAPDHDVEYRVNMPKGTTERSRQLLKKAASVNPTVGQKSVFDRLGAIVKREEDDDDDDDDDAGPSGRLSAVPARLRKSVSFASGTKEIIAGSPEVTSTTSEYEGRLESDKIARKVSALKRLGSQPTNEVVKVIGGHRTLLVAKRTTTTTVKTSKSIFDRLG